MKIKARFRHPTLAITFLLLLVFCPGCRANAVKHDSQRSKAAIAWGTFEDPFEHAFSVAVPHGWTVRGGLFRLGYSDERPMVDVRSPDGTVAIRLGDVSIPSYALPNLLHSKEGQIYDLGAQAKLVVARYRTGPEFVVLYSQARFHELCRDPNADASDTGFSVPDYLPVDSSAETSAGQIAWRCETPNGSRVVFAYTRTTRGNGIWQVPTIVSFIAPPEQSALARSIALHMVGSFRLSSAWVEHQKQMDAEGMEYQRLRQQGRIRAIQQQMRQFEAQMQAMQNQVNAFERRQASQAVQVQGFDDALVGITPTTDPFTGEQRDVWTGTKANYWVNGLGQVINSTDAPAAGWRQLRIP